jgi:hypothetical protein
LAADKSDPLMKKLLNLFLLLAFLIGYLEWGTGTSAFIVQAEADIFMKAKANPIELLHPFVLIPLMGQLIMLYTLFQNIPTRALSLTGLACLSTVMLFLLFIGIITGNVRIIASTTPFLVIGILILMSNRRRIA